MSSPLGLGHDFEPGQIDHLVMARLFDLPQNHHRHGPSRQGGQGISGVHFGARWGSTGVARDRHYAPIGLRQGVRAEMPQILLRYELVFIGT